MIERYIKKTVYTMYKVKDYYDFINESKTSSDNIIGLEKVLKLPHNSGVFTSVNYNKNSGDLVIEQPKDLNPMDSGAVLGAINQNKKDIKKLYSGIKKVVIGDLSISI